MNYKKINKCRICGSKELVKIGSLGMIAVSDFTTNPQKGHRMPLELIYCENCTLVQLAHNFNRDLLYKEYWYVSGLNKAIIKDLKEIAEYSKKARTHIDIGANDGTLLKYSKAKTRIAVEPSNIEPNYGIWHNAYWEDVRLNITVDLITAIACLYDLPDPNKFITNIKNHLASDGLFISQFQPLVPMVELNDIGNICHEHLEFYSYKSLVYLFEKNGLEIFKVEKNGMNGGSYRVFARHYKTGSIKFKEKEYGVKELKDFFKRIEENKRKFLEFSSKNQHKAIYGYGASTKANTILQYYGISQFKPLQGIIDVNPSKMGMHTINSNVIVIDDDFIDVADYLWVFPYGFLEYFKKKEKRFKGKWVTTIPKFKIC